AGFDQAAPGQFIDVLPELHSGTFAFDADALTRINGAPLSAGPHVLHLVATDGAGLNSVVTDVAFTLDLSAQGSISTVVTPVGSLYQYRFTLSGPPGNG